MRILKLLALLAGTGIVVAGLLPPDTPIPPAGQAGAPHRPLTPAEEEQFLRGRTLFDQNFGHDMGVGPQFNGDSCRACHQDPVVGGAGGIDVQVQRPLIDDGNGNLISPAATGALAHTHHRVGTEREEIPANVVVVEERNSPSILGLGLVETITDATILANEDPNDLDNDKIRGIAHRLGPNVIGRFGWKADIPSLRAFARDALSNELGLTVPVSMSSFGITSDNDGVPDPEISQAEIADLAFFMSMLDFPPQTATDPEGEALFTTIGCAKCHVPVMDGVELYSNLLLHNVLPANFQGATAGVAGPGLYRTPPLRGVARTAPYFHDGRSPTLDAAIRRHEGEAVDVRDAYVALTDAQRAALIRFLESR